MWTGKLQRCIPNPVKAVRYFRKKTLSKMFDTILETLLQVSAYLLQRKESVSNKAPKFENIYNQKSKSEIKTAIKQCIFNFSVRDICGIIFPKFSLYF